MAGADKSQAVARIMLVLRQLRAQEKSMTSTRRILYAVAFDAAEPAITWQVAKLARAWYASIVLVGNSKRACLLGLRSANREEIGRKLSAVDMRLKRYAAEVRGSEGAPAHA